MKNRVLTLGLMLAFGLPMGLMAQEEAAEEYPRELAQVVTWNVQPDHAPMFEEAVQKVVKAAELANLSGDYRWAFWNDVYTYILVFPVANMAYFDDEDQFWRQFNGTEGEAMVGEAFAMFDEVNAEVMADEIVELKMEWSYFPENGIADDAVGFAHVDIATVKSGKDEEFEAVVKEFIAFFTELDVPYATHAHDVVIGKSAVHFVTFFDNKADYYGANGTMAKIEAKGAQEQWQAILAKWSGVIDGMRHFDTMYRADMSYWPAEPAQQAAK